ncbi:F-box protein [Cardamine amara subsp. amara]|uniref:F-box protein n=1 Tax=Cardamine amara subsp. amara TaxID=228776 RepID=A0ABD1BQ52_CARAN
MLSDLPKEMADEVLSRLPVTSLRGVRSTCKKWNTLSKSRTFTMLYIREAKKKQRKEFQVAVILDCRLSLFSVNLLNPSIDLIGMLLDTRGIISTLLRRHKVLRFVDEPSICEFEIYSFRSNSWKVLHVNPDWDIGFFRHGLSLGGNTYWIAQDKKHGTHGPFFVLCFDFTTEKFEQRLPLPFQPFGLDTVALSSVRGKQIAVLWQKRSCSYTLKIWISSRIEPNVVSWNKVLLMVDMKRLTGFPFLFSAGSFFVDEKKKVALVLDKEGDGGCTSDFRTSTRNIAYIIGNNGYFKTVDLGESRKITCWPLGCSYVPSSVQIKQAAPRANHKTA